MRGLLNSAAQQGHQTPRPFYPSILPSSAGGFSPLGPARWLLLLPTMHPHQSTQSWKGGVGVRAEGQLVERVFPHMHLSLKQGKYPSQKAPLFISLAKIGSHGQHLLQRRLGSWITGLFSLWSRRYVRALGTSMHSFHIHDSRVHFPLFESFCSHGRWDHSSLCQLKEGIQNQMYLQKGILICSWLESLNFTAKLWNLCKRQRWKGRHLNLFP